MAVEDLDALRQGLPGVFRDVTMPPEWDDEYVFVPVTEPLVVPTDIAESVGNLDGFGGNVLEPLELPPVLSGDFPGAPTTYPSTGGTVSRIGIRGRTGITLPPAVPPDCLAFYLPFHYFYPNWWGVYLTVEGTASVAQFIYQYDPYTVTASDGYLAAQAFLYGHEYYHHKTECFATKLEVTHRTTLYKAAFERVFQKYAGSSRCYEETLATASGYNKALEPFQNDAKKKDAIDQALRLYISGLPAGYREALGILSGNRAKELETEFAEQNQFEAFPANGSQNSDIWMVFPYAFQGISRRTSHVNYIVRRNSSLAHRAGLSLRYLRYKELVQKLAELAGCEYRRPGKGGHEVWESANGNQVIIPRHPGELSTGTVRAIIKQAGLPYSIEQFRSATGRQVRDRNRVIS